MTDPVQNQTDQLLVWLKVVAHGIENLNLTVMISATAIVAVLLVIAFRRRPK